MKHILYKFVFKYIHRHWNIAIADLDAELNPQNIRWMKHNYDDRWFADPFIIAENQDSFIVLAEEFMRDSHKARIAQLTVTKEDCTLITNNTVLDISTHLSFPNFFEANGIYYIYPESGLSGHTTYYEYGLPLIEKGELSPLPLADAIIEQIDDNYYLFFTIGEECNGNRLMIYSSKQAFGSFEPFQEIVFSDNIARRAGKMFHYHDRLISPAQICNNSYGEGVSLQAVHFKNGQFKFEEIKRIFPKSKEYPSGLHTFNVWGSSVIIDSYRTKNSLLNKFYMKLRNQPI